MRNKILIDGQEVNLDNTENPNLEIESSKGEVLSIEIKENCQISGVFEIPLKDLNSKYRIKD
jgi:hypothetical protein